MALNAPRYAAAVEALMGWSTFRERYMKATLRYKVRLERMEDTRLARKVYLWSERNSRWMKRCMRMVDRSNMQILWTYGRSERRQGEYEWRMRHDSGEGNELDLRKWEKVIDQEVRRVGLNKWRNEMERKDTLELYKEKGTPRYERWCDGSLGSDLLFRARAQCMDVNVRNYRWSESGSKVCQRCDMGEDETVAEHVLLECDKYDCERRDMMRIVLAEMGYEVWEVQVKHGQILVFVLRIQSWYMLLCPGSVVTCRRASRQCCHTSYYMLPHPTAYKFFTI